MCVYGWNESLFLCLRVVLVVWVCVGGGQLNASRSEDSVLEAAPSKRNSDGKSACSRSVSACLMSCMCKINKYNNEFTRTISIFVAEGISFLMAIQNIVQLIVRWCVQIVRRVTALVVYFELRFHKRLKRRVSHAVIKWTSSMTSNSETVTPFKNGIQNQIPLLEKSHPNGYNHLWSPAFCYYPSFWRRLIMMW